MAEMSCTMCSRPFGEFELIKSMPTTDGSRRDMCSQCVKIEILQDVVVELGIMLGQTNPGFEQRIADLLETMEEKVK